MYFDEETGRYYRSKQDSEIIKLWTMLQEGQLRPVEGFSRYTITPAGVVLNIARAKPVRPFSIGQRLAVGLVNDAGRQTTLSLARLVAHHFIPAPDDEQYYDAVNKDGNLSNVCPDNLEWVPRWKRHARQENYSVDIS